MSYNYRTFTQTSRPYKYGEGEKLRNKEEALNKMRQLENKIKTELSLMKIYELSDVKVVEIENALQIVVTVKIPIVVEEV